jgi:1,4-alpha-glucan branching enzyme
MSAKNKTKESDTACGSQCVCLRLTRPDARQICIAGSFNDWHPSVTPMIRLSDGMWAKELVLPPGSYEYRFVVDGEWVDDPAATPGDLEAQLGPDERSWTDERRARLTYRW